MIYVATEMPTLFLCVLMGVLPRRFVFQGVDIKMVMIGQLDLNPVINQLTRIFFKTKKQITAKN